MLALQTAWLLSSDPILESRLDQSDKDKEEKDDTRTQVRSRIWLAVSEAALEPEAFLLPEFRHLFKVHLALFLTLCVLWQLSCCDRSAAPRSNWHCQKISTMGTLPSWHSL